GNCVCLQALFGVAQESCHPSTRLPPFALNVMKLTAALSLGISLLLCGEMILSAADTSKAEVILRHANVITVDAQFCLAQAVAINGDKILAVGSDKEISLFAGPQTRVIDAKGKTVLPGLYDSHVHSYRASVSEFGAPMPVLISLAEAFQYIRQ